LDLLALSGLGLETNGLKLDLDFGTVDFDVLVLDLLQVWTNTDP